MMADSASESCFQSYNSGSRYIGNSFFNIPGLFVGFGFKGSSDSESIKSPSSPLEFSLFSNLSSQFSLKHPKSPNQNGHQNKCHSSKVGLGIINLLVDEPKSTGPVLSSSKRKNVIFGSDVRTGHSERSKSFPADYMLLLLSQSKTPKSSSSSSITDAFSGKSGVPLDSESFQNTSSASLSPESHLSSKKFCSENRTTTMSSSSLFGNNSLDVKTSSLPVPIGSLSASEIELSEDYTCIISYGPNPKTTHIFGDCILECHTNDLPNFNTTENPNSDSLESSTPFPSDEFLSFCYSCKKKLEAGDDIYMSRGAKAFCCSDCRSEEIFAEDEIGTSCCDPQNSSPASSYHEDVFLTGMAL